MVKINLINNNNIIIFQHYNKIIKIIDIFMRKDIKLNDLTKEECNKYLNGNYKFISNNPRMNSPLSLIDEQNNFFQYSNSRKRVET